MSASIECMHFSRLNPRVELKLMFTLKHTMEAKEILQSNSIIGFFFPKTIKDRRRPEASASLA